MKTYLNEKKQWVSQKPERFEVGKDYFGVSIYNDDLVYFYSNYYDNVTQLNKDDERYSKNHFKNCVKIYKHQIPTLLTYLGRLFSKQLGLTLDYAPNIGDIVILKTHNYKFKVLDNTPKLFIKLQSIINPDYISVFCINELKK